MVDPEERRARASGRSAAKPSNGDEIQERYLRRASSEINELGDELLALGDELHVPVLGSGHPLGDVFLLKYRPVHSEIAEGVAFFGRSGQALLKSLQRLAVDPLAVYGTNCLKFGTEDPAAARGGFARELHNVQPKLVVAMALSTRRAVDASRDGLRRSRRRGMASAPGPARFVAHSAYVDDNCVASSRSRPVIGSRPIHPGP